MTEASSQPSESVASYKQILSDLLDRRPSGTRQRLAAALGKNRSFVSQICNPAYAVPIPAVHLDLIFEICHFAPDERRRFLAAYLAAHPNRPALVHASHKIKPHTVYLPDLGDDGRNARLHTLISDFVRQVAKLIEDEPKKREAPMKKLINAVDNVLTESLSGFAEAHSDLVTLGAEGKFIRRKTLKPGKVGLISGGGSGHEPLHGGFVGHGMLDAACPGQVFTSPTPDQMIAAAEAVDGGAGLLFIVKNYEGDIMNFEMAREMGSKTIETVITDDDVAVENSLYTTGRRGVAGTMVVEKVVGAAAERGADLAALKRLGDKINKASRSMGVALTSCTVPAAGKPTFALGDDEMEMGVGIHGEPGRRRVKLMPADAIAEEMIGAIVGDLAAAKNAPVLLLVNGFGGTPSMELYLMYHAAAKVLGKRGVKIARSLVGSYVTSLDMAGCSLTVTALDDETVKLWDAPVHTPGLRWGM